MSLKKLTASLNASFDVQRNENKPACSDRDHILDFQMEILHKLYPNIEIECGPKRHLFNDDNDEFEEIKQDISAIWTKYSSLLKKIRLWRYLFLISLSIILLLITPNIIAYYLYIEYDIDTQKNNSCSLFTLIYELCIIILIGWPLLYLRLRTHYASLTQKWRNLFINNMVIYINHKLATKYADQQWLFEVIYPIKVQAPKKYPQCWCYIRITANHDDHRVSQTDNQQPLLATRYFSLHSISAILRL